MLNVGLFGAKDTQDEEFFYPYYRLQEENHRIITTVISTDGKGFTGKYGIPYKGSVISAKLAINYNFDGLIIPGGWGAEILRSDQYILEIVKKTNNKNGVIGAICHGPWVLCSAGIFNDNSNRRANDLFNAEATCFYGMKDDLINAGARYVKSDCCVFNNLVTAPHYRNNAIFVKTFLDILYAKSS